METLIGVKGRDFVVVAADRYAQFSICRMKKDDDKILEIDSNKLLACAGPVGDRTQFGEYIRKNTHLYRLRNGYHMNTKATAHFTRQQLALALRRNPYHVDLLLAGCDESGPVLFWFDYLSSMASVDKAAHGYGAYFVNGLLDRYYKPDMTQEEALDIINKCRDELATRFLVSQTDFTVKVITKESIKTIILQ
eukprot:GHVT01095202.1.p1 GENE.GHVT01095202.1~~GHVT01095202.1.p1  ORF type:complete len:193 (-),score=29.59 GHVT01095202.1:348-926(-)